MNPLTRRREDRPERFRRGVYLLPSMMTVSNLLCGYASLVYSTRGDFDTAAVLIGVAMVVDTLDGYFARLTHSQSAFGAELDSLADVVSFGVAPAILAFTWGLWPLGRFGWAAGFVYVTAAAVRLARFNIQGMTASDKRYFAGLPSPAAASVTASTVFLYPWGVQDPRIAALALPMLLLPGFLMVSTIRFRSVKAIDLGWRRSPVWLLAGSVVIAAIVIHPRIALVVLSYTYVLAALVIFIYGRLRRRPPATAAAPAGPPPADV
ncbi:MAG TPA: CDP-diacylglycerol--serine O-phosphatidyltransferase [Vicinamibacterales bacterium]|jgi:CDP-diacylglycerol--serine O-phosphatidyltransferase